MIAAWSRRWLSRMAPWSRHTCLHDRYEASRAAATMTAPQRVGRFMARPTPEGWAFVQPAAAPSPLQSWRFVHRALLAVSLLAAARSVAFADAVLLLGEPYGRFATFSPTGHASVYLTRVCASTPTVVRRCEAGETGAVISRYHRVGGRDWIAVPLMPYLYAVDHATDVPSVASGATVSTLRDAYRRAWLREVAPDTDATRPPPGDWIQAVGAVYDRRLVAFSVTTTPAQDDLLIATLNSRRNDRQFNLMFRNCADFVQGVLNLYHPGAIRSSLTADLGFTTPKQLAKALVRYGHRRPDAQVSGFVVPQVPGSRRQSRPARGVLESLVKTKKYAIPLAVLQPTVPAGLAAAYLLGGRFRPLSHAARTISPAELEQMALAWGNRTELPSHAASTPVSARPESAESAVVARRGSSFRAGR